MQIIFFKFAKKTVAWGEIKIQRECGLVVEYMPEALGFIPALQTKSYVS